MGNNNRKPYMGLTIITDFIISALHYALETRMGNSIAVAWTLRRLKSQSTHLCVQQHIDANNTEYIKASLYCLFVRIIHWSLVESPQGQG